MVCDHYHCGWCGPLDACMVDCIHRFGVVGDLFSVMLNGEVVYGDVS